MKRLSIVFSIAVCLVAAVGCGGGGEPTAPTNDAIQDYISSNPEIAKAAMDEFEANVDDESEAIKELKE